MTDLPGDAAAETANHPPVEVNGDEPTALYRFYDPGRTLLYVGITKDLSQRWEDHAAEKFWWPQVARKTVVLYGSRKEALDAEAIAIVTESPVHNVAGQVPAGRDKKITLKRLERRMANAERELRQMAFTLDDEFQARVDAYARANGCTSHVAVATLLALGLVKAEENAAQLAALDAEIAALREHLAAQEVDASPITSGA